LDGNIVNGNLVGFIPQIFVTFGVVESCKLLQLKDFLKTSCKVGVEGLQQVFEMLHYAQRRKGLNGQVGAKSTTMHCHQIKS
jgi:hypothetical protein